LNKKHNDYLVDPRKSSASYVNYETANNYLIQPGKLNVSM